MTDDLLSTVDQQAIAEAIAHQTGIDRAEAGPKAPHGALPYKGVIIDSRWDIMSEYRLLRAVVDTLPDLMRVRIESIWCDSNGTASYIVTVKPGRFAPDLPYAVEETVIAVGGGHNGIMVQSDVAEGNVTLDCHWNEGPEE